jgi:AcrR family transcriptional regulator
VDEDGVKMPRMETGGWERRKLQTRIALAEAAVRLFRDRGYEATTVEDIARAAHSSSSTFFRYFRTKEDVLFLNIREIQDHFRNFLGQPIPGLSCWEQIHLGINIGMLQVVRPSTEVEEFSIRSWLNEPAVRGRFLELVTEMENTMAAALAAERRTDATSRCSWPRASRPRSTRRRSTYISAPAVTSSPSWTTASRWWPRPSELNRWMKATGPQRIVSLRAAAPVPPAAPRPPPPTHPVRPQHRRHPAAGHREDPMNPL